jgi:hypothetical protein
MTTATKADHERHRRQAAIHASAMRLLGQLDRDAGPDEVGVRVTLRDLWAVIDARLDDRQDGQS